MTCRVGNLPRELIRKPRPAAQPPAPLFAWDARDTAERDFSMANLCEVFSSDWDAYVRYAALSRRYPDRKAYCDAAARVRDRLPDQVEMPAGCWACPPEVAEAIIVAREEAWCAHADTPRANRCVARIVSEALPAPAGDAPINNPPFALCLREIKSLEEMEEGSVTRESVTKPPPPLSLFTVRPTTDSTAKTLPERKDMLPDTDHTQLLSGLGIIASRGELLSMPPPEDRPGFFSGTFH